MSGSVQTKRDSNSLNRLQLAVFACLLLLIILLAVFAYKSNFAFHSEPILLTGTIAAGTMVLVCMLRFRAVFQKQAQFLSADRDRLVKLERIGGFAHWELDFEQNRLELSPNAYDILDFPTGSLEDADIFISHVHPQDREEVRNRFRERKDSQYTLEYRIINPQEEIIWIEVFSEARKDTRGTIDGRLGVLRNITAFRVREDALTTAVRKTEKALELAEMFEWEADLETRRFSIMEPYGTKLFLQPGKYTFTFEEFFSRIDQTQRDQAMRRMTLRDTEEDTPLEMELRFNRIDGEIFYLRLFGSHVRDSQGWVTRRFGIAQDISTLREAERALEESEREKNLVIDNINIGLALWTPDRRLIWANRVLCNLFKADNTELRRDELCYRLLELNDHPCPNCPIPEALHQRRTATQEIAVHDRILSVTAVPFIDRYGEITRIITMVNDISGQKAVQEQLLQVQKMDAVGQLAAGIAHDFNNLLHVIISYTDHALEVCDAGIRKYLEPIAEAARKGHDLVTDLLTFSRSESNVYPQALLLTEFIPGFVTRIRPFLKQDIRVETVIDQSVSEISADPGVLEQILDHLVKNAEDAMPDGGQLTIEVRDVHLKNKTHMRNEQIVPPGDFVTLSVRDTGIGIEEADIPLIFNPFFTKKEIGHGKGLGLSTVYALTKKHNGFIEVESQLGSGTSFTLYFPIRTDTDVDTEELIRSLRQSIASDPIRVLLVDDDPTVRRVTVRTLEKIGYVLMEASDGQTAIDLLSEHAGSIQLVLLDVVLPRRSGREVYDHIRTVSPETRVIFATGYASHYLDNLPPDASVLHKPYAKSALLRTIKQAFASSRLNHSDIKNPGNPPAAKQDEAE